MDFEQQLRTAFAPCKPRPQLRATILARRSALGALKGKSRAGSRTLLVGTILAVAAAAAMLALHLGDKPEPLVAVTPPEMPAIEPVAPAEEAPLSVAQAAPEPKTTKTAVLKGALPPVKPFTVKVLPLQSAATDTGAKAAIDSFFATFVSSLKAVPGLSLIQSDADDPTDSELPDFQLTVMGSGTDMSNQFGITLLGDERRMLESKQKAIKEQGAAPKGVSFGMSVKGDIVPNCVPGMNGGSSDCRSPSAWASSLVETMRKRIFPEDPLLRVQLQNQLLNESLDSTQRLKALADIGIRYSASPSEALQDPAIVRGAIALATTTSDPAIRAQVWRALRGSRNPELVNAVAASLLRELDGEVRLQAVILLQEDFSSDLRAREALEIIAREESRPLVRALAIRALRGETAWKEYIVASLKDANRSDADRIEAFMYYVATPGRTPGTFALSGQLTRSPELLDDEAVRAWTRFLPEAGKAAELKPIMPSIVSALGGLKNPAIASMLLGMLEQTAEPALKYSIVRELSRRDDDPAVRAALEKVSREDPDARLREFAADTLKGLSASK